MARLPTNLVAGQAGHVAHSNQAYEVANQYQTWKAPRMINVLDPPEVVTALAAVGNNSTDDYAALQAIFDFLKGSPANEYWVWFPFRNLSGTTARYLTSRPLRVWTNTRIVGPATIASHSSFDWVNHPYWEDPLYKPVGNPQPGDIGLIEMWNDVSGRGGVSRLFVDDIILDCNNQAGSLGLFSKLQQPAYTYKLRINRCDTGWQVWGQQSDHFMAEIIECNVGLYLGPDLNGLGTYGDPGTTCKFMSFYTLNIEQYSEAAVRMDCDGPNWIYSGHFEGLGDNVNAKVIDCREGAFSLMNGWATHGGNTNHVFVIGDKSPLPGLKDTTYAIKNFRMAQTNTGGQLMIDDKVRVYQRLVDLQRNIDSFETLFQNDTHHDYDAAVEWIGDEGGFVRIGGLKGGTSAPAGHSGAQFSTRANVGQDERQVRWYQSDGTLRGGVHQSGNLVLGSYTNANRPVATTVEAGTVIWNTDDAAINLSDGTVWRDAVGAAT